MVKTPTRRSACIVLTGVGLTTLLTFGAVSTAFAAVIDGPIDLGTAASYGVLAASAVTNTGPTVINGDLGISPQTSLTGFGGAPNGTVNGTTNATNTAAAQAQQDTTTAYNVAASLDPTLTGLGELNGLSLVPGVYSGGALELSNNGALTLAGSADSVWVFQAASTLTIGSDSDVIITGGASACNVFWQVGSSASIGVGAEFQGTVLAQQSITATTSATIDGRLLARGGAVTLDNNRITVDTGCTTPGTVTEAPIITSPAPADATVGTPYSHTVTATGTPTPGYSVTAGTLPAGLTLDVTTGVISGTPTTPGSSQFTVTASNGVTPDASETYTVTTVPAAVTPVPPVESPTPGESPTPVESPTPGVVTPPTPGTGPTELAATGSDSSAPLAGGAVLLLAGIGLTLAVGIRRRRGLTAEL